MYLPKHQYTFKSLDELANVEALVDKLGNLFNKPGKNLVVTSFGEVFDRKTVDIERGDFSKAEKLFPTESPEQAESRDSSGYEYLTADTPERSSFSKITSTKLPPSSKEIEAGVMKRCFYKNTSTGKVKEILRTQAIKLAKNRQRFEQVVCLDWVIKGPAKDQTINGYYLSGVESRNEKQIQKLKEALPGAETLIQSPTEYLQEVIIPEGQAIKPTPPGLDIPAPSKGL